MTDDQANIANIKLECLRIAGGQSKTEEDRLNAAKAIYDWVTGTVPAEPVAGPDPT